MTEGNSNGIWRKRLEHYNELQWAKDTRYLDYLLSFVNPQKSDSILDVGTGTGIMAKALLGKCKRVVAVDNSRSVVNAFESNSSIDIRLQDVRKLSFKSHSFDKVVVRMVMHHVLADIEKAFSEIKRVLKQNGVFFLFEGVPPSYDEEVVKDYEEIFKMKEQRRVFTYASLAEMLKPFFDMRSIGYFWQREMSFRNWLECDSSLSAEQKEKIFEFRKNSSPKVREAYNLKEQGNDLLLDFRTLNIEAIPKKHGLNGWVQRVLVNG